MVIINPRELPCPLDPQVGPSVPFQRLGKRWRLGNRPTRMAVEVADNDNGEVSVVEIDCRTWETVEAVEAAE